MSDMIKRLAIALTPYVHHGIATPEEAARAALAAMREPTEAMKDGDYAIAHSSDVDYIFSQMILAAEREADAPKDRDAG